MDIRPGSQRPLYISGVAGQSEAWGR